MKRMKRFTPVFLAIVLITFVVGVFTTSAQGVPQCVANVPTNHFLMVQDNGDAIVVTACEAGTAPMIDGQSMIPEDSARWTHTLTVTEGIHTYRGGSIELQFEAVRLDADGQAHEYENMHVESANGVPLNVLSYRTFGTFGHYVMPVSGQGFVSWGNTEWWNWDTQSWTLSPIWFSDHNILAVEVPQPSNCDYPVPFEPFVWAREDGMVGVCVDPDPEDDFPKVNGEYLTPETNPDTPYNWISEDMLTGTITVTTSGVAPGVGRTVVATQEILQPGQGSATLLNITAVDSVVNVLQYVVAPETGSVDTVYSVRGFGYGHGSTPNHQNWYYNASGWEETPIWFEYMVMGLEQTTWQTFMPVIVNQQPCQPVTPEPAVVYVFGQLGVCANSTPVLDGSPMSANSGSHWNYATTTGAGTHTLIINDITYPILVDGQGDFNDGVVSVYGGTLESVVRMTMGSANVYSVRGQGWSIDLPWGMYTLEYYNPGTDSWRLATPDEWTNTTYLRVTPHS